MYRAVLFLFLPVACFGQAGHWEGAIKRADRDVLITVDLHNQRGWMGSFSMPGTNGPPLDLTDLEVKDGMVSFHLPDFPGDPVFRGLLGEGGTNLQGTVTIAENATAFELRRIGDPQVTVVPRSTHLTSELLGDWQGTLKFDPPVRLAIHFSNNPAGIGNATLDTPDTGARGIHVTSVRQDDEVVQIEVRILGGSFEGKLAADKSRIEGTWKQNGRTAELIFLRQQ
jgi:hypothetical protein